VVGPIARREAVGRLRALVGEVTGMRRIKNGHPARMALRHTAIDFDEPSVAATACFITFRPAISKSLFGRCLVGSTDSVYQRPLTIAPAADWCNACYAAPALEGRRELSPECADARRTFNRSSLRR
jgi:hypothetical protein